MGFFGRLLGKRKNKDDRSSMVLSGKFLVESTYGLAGIGIGLVGSITYGNIRKGDTGLIGSKKFRVQAIKADHKTVDVASAGKTVDVWATIIGMPENIIGRTVDFYSRK